MNASFLHDIRSQPETLRAALPGLRGQAARLPALAGIDRIVLTGSGDSFIAALAAEPSFEDRLGRLPVAVVPALDASAYLRWGPEDLLVIASVSGEVRRSVEAADRARAAGARTVAITADGGSALASRCHDTLVTPEPFDRSIPHARDYTIALLAFGALLERLSGREAGELDVWPDAASAVLERAFDALADVRTGVGTTWFLGAGPDRATARYGAMKFWEAAGLEAWWDDLEEFAHGSLLMARPGDRAIVFAPGAGAARATAMMPGLRELGITPITIGPAPIDPDVLHLDAPSLRGQAWQPLTSCLPVQVLTYVEAEARDLDVSTLLDGRPYADAYRRVHLGWVRDGARPAVARRPGIVP